MAELAENDFDARTGISLERIWPPSTALVDWFSQIGGVPKLPPSVDWPSIVLKDGTPASLDFLAQIRMSDLPQVPDRELLPKTGILYFFALAFPPAPLEDFFGRDAWRVIYWPGDPENFEPATPPFAFDALMCDFCPNSTPALELRDPDAFPLALFPRCPVRPIAATSWQKPESFDLRSSWMALADRWPGSEPPVTDFKYDQAELPRRVEDALLHLNAARNAWAEGLMPFEQLLSSHYAYYLKFRSDGPTVIKTARIAYDDWLLRVKEEALRLRNLGRSTLLSASERLRIQELAREVTTIKKIMGDDQGVHYNQELFAQSSLATLLLDEPELAATYADEVAAAHPGRLLTAGYETHRMLGHSYSVQSESDYGRIILLQLGSDWFGPRFQWWDMGNITFSISREDLKALNFNGVHAEIAGY